MKLSWRRIVFFGLLMFIVPFLIVYANTKNDNNTVKPALQPEPVKRALTGKENPVMSDINVKNGPLTYMTGHNKETYTLLYYPDLQLQRLVPVAKRLSGYEPSLEEALTAMLDRNYAPSGLGKPAFLPDTRLLSVGVNGNTAIADFGELLPASADETTRRLIIKTVENVARQFSYEKLEIRVKGKRLTSLPQGLENPIRLNNRRNDSYNVYRPLIANGLVYLYPEAVDGALTPEEIVKDFLNSLTRDITDTKKLYISPDVRVLSVTVQSGQATINFNRALQDGFDDFARQFSNRQMAENFLFDALVTSLTDIPGVKEVRFMVEGRQVNSLNNPSVGNYFFARTKNINPVN